MRRGAQESGGVLVHFAGAETDRAHIQAGEPLEPDAPDQIAAGSSSCGGEFPSELAIFAPLCGQYS